MAVQAEEKDLNRIHVHRREDSNKNLLCETSSQPWVKTSVGAFLSQFRS